MKKTPLTCMIFCIISPLSLIAKDLIIVLGGAQEGIRNVRKVAEELATEENFDAIAIDYLKRSGIAQSTEKLQKRIADVNTDTYDKVHFYCFTLGGIVLRKALVDMELKKLGRIVLIKAPLEDNMSRAAQTVFRPQTIAFFLGRSVIEIADNKFRTFPVETEIGLLITTEPNKLALRMKKRMERKFDTEYYDTLHFNPDSLFEGHKDFCYYFIDHTELYKKPELYRASLSQFFQTGSFGSSVSRVPNVQYDLFFPKVPAQIKKVTSK